MFEIVWLIIICAWVVIGIKKKNALMQGRNNSSANSTTTQAKGSGQSIFKPAAGPTIVPRPRKPGMPQSNSQHSMMGPVHQRQTTTPNVPNSVATPQIKQREASAPEYQKKGDQVIAVRLMEGDAVPGGCRTKVCGYCGADNLVPEYGKEKYICYFCHERL